ncbi:Small ubiquitin- modifier 3 [Cichlidogyrus casuarinus]|uniref:Small ubiquitin-related modifier n=1 Tax=Cichlidogyrus casuarinus TaxID=1844966 RepID=A0ABD2Q4Y6_9PLAT
MSEEAGDKPTEESPDHINIRVQNQEGSVIHFKIKKTTLLKKLMNAYCTRLGVKLSSVRFIFDGDTIKDSDTPDALDMHNDDTIEVFQSQTGGKY